MKRWIVFALSLFLLAGCAAEQTEDRVAEDTYNLYFVAAEGRNLGSDAIVAEPVVIAGGPDMDLDTLAETVVERMLEGPKTEGLVSVIPRSTSLVDVMLTGSLARVDLSSAYSMLSGIDLTLADYCLTLALTELEGINYVSVTVGGRELLYRDKQVFRERDALLTAADDVVGVVDVLLWFRHAETGELVPEPRSLTLYEGDTQAETLMASLMRGPEDENLVSALPEDFLPLSVWVNEGICYVNLPSVLMQAVSMPEAVDMIQAIVNSMCTLERVDGVQIRVDGDGWGSFKGVDISGILEPSDEPAENRQ